MLEKREGRARGAVWAKGATGYKMEKGGSWSRTSRERRRKWR